MPNAYDQLWRLYQNMVGNVAVVESAVIAARERPELEPLRDGTIIIQFVTLVISRETKAIHVQFAAKLIERPHIVKW